MKQQKNIISMKKLVVIILVLISNMNLLSQQKIVYHYNFTHTDLKYMDSLDKNGINWDEVNSEFIVLLNQYRRENNLDTLIYSDSTYSAAKFMTEYCMKIKKVTHISDVSGYETLGDRRERFNLLYKNSNGRIWECGLSTSLPFAVITERLKGKENISIAEHILDMWILSKSHNKILLTKEAKYVGMCANHIPFSPLMAFLVLY